MALASVACLAASAGGFAGELRQSKGPPPVPEFTRPEIEPTLGDFLLANPVARRNKLRRTDPLLRPPFVGPNAGPLKGLAAAIRAQQLDVPNRVRAARFLGTVDCVAFPEARTTLVQTLETDPSEEVRFEAALALRLMLSRCMSLNADPNCQCRRCCEQRNLQAEIDEYAELAAREATPPPKKDKESLLKKPAPSCPLPEQSADELRFDCCRGCCDADVLNKLSIRAYGRDEQGCWFEPSDRVRAAAASAMSICPCYPVESSGIVVPTPDPNGGETDPEPPQEANPQVPPDQGARRVTSPERTPVASAAPQVPGLKGHCVVHLKSRQFVQGRPEFSSVFEEHTYHFASADAKAQFDAQPEAFAPAFGGVDPVEYVKRQRMVDGQFLRAHNGRFYLFSTKENRTAFTAQPERYAARAAGENYQARGK